MCDFLQGLKKHKLLREDILPALASNRKVQRLLNEFMDLLSEYGSPETHTEPHNTILPMMTSQATDQVDVLPSLNDHVQVDPPVIDRRMDQVHRKLDYQIKGSSPSRAVHQMDRPVVPANQINQILLVEERVTCASGKDDLNLVMVKDSLNQPRSLVESKAEKVVVALPANDNNS